MTSSGARVYDSAMPESDAVVRAEGLRKSYGAFDAVKAVDLEIRSGEIFGLIGPDGAGKTSIFHIMGGVMKWSGGEIEVLGKSPSEARPQIGYLTQQFSLYLDLSVEENIRYSASLRNVRQDEYRERTDDLLRLMDLRRFKSRLAGNLSGGMKQKLALCCSLVARPELLLLDEPTTGVDPVSRREFWDILATVAAEGVTIAVATPYLDEAERCNRIALIYEGRIKQTGTPDELKDSLHLERLEVRAGRHAELAGILEKEPRDMISDVQQFGDRLDILVADPVSAESLVTGIGERLGIAIDVSRQRPTLENVFVHSLRKEGDEEEMPAFDFQRASRERTGETAIVARQMSRRFGDFWAVKGVSIEVGYGEIFGLLGANGAGKTTTIKMLCGLIGVTRGEMELCGQRGNLRSSGLRGRLGYMSQKFTLYDDLTVLENMEFYCGVYGISPHLRARRIAWALESCGLSGQESLITGKLPGGWKQRLAFGACVMHEPEVLFLDEPTSGVDPLARRQLWDLIRTFARNGTAVLVTTHFLEEAEHCHRMAFMAGGEVVAQGSPGEIKAEQPGQLIELRAQPIQAAYLALKDRFESWRVSIFADRIHLVALSGDDLERASQIVTAAGARISSHRQIPFSLEDSFIGIVERAQMEVVR
ncbi:MAG: ABC transporter ATP-binding protein [Candidatus Melainabacteria bacterium]|nr:ABC transporter ATP-binding protein [Candidatus Melainabacteria bacterium]